MNHAQLAVDAIFSVHGCDASYQPPSGPELPDIRVIRRVGDQMAGIESLRIIREARLIDVRASEVAAPVKGGVFVVGGQSLKITADPRREDPDRLVWTCEVTPA